MAGLLTQEVFDALQSICLTTGNFDRVSTHEPKNAPGRGLTCAVWLDKIGPAASGLSSTSARVTFKIRLYTSMLMEPADLIDPLLMKAADDVMAALTADFDLGGILRCIDLVGMGQGHPLSLESGYINIDTKVLRVYTINVPCIINDAWAQS